MQPLAERLRPRTLDEYIGQKHLVGPGAVLRKMIDAGRISSFILWGPPGVGKTTLAQIIANKLETPFYTLSAVTSGVKDVRDVIERAKSNRFFSQASPILFIDEIHRFSKSQQDSLLGAVEQGTVTLIGATTENPSFEVIRPLLSRCQLYTLKSLEKDDLLELLQRAITTDTVLKERKIELKETTAMLRFSGGDARKLLNILELVVDSEAADPVLITDDMVTERLQQNPLAYDKDGEMHYDIISAFIKSIRGSDPDGAIYWLARMVEGGEQKIRHRGPDWSGIYVGGSAILAHERLSIVDPESGGQPLYSPDRKQVLAVNGEIYNHRDIRARYAGKYAFQTGSDCEVILALYKDKGIRFLEELNGIFAFALYDEETDDYLIARDPIGVIPLYIGRDKDGHIYFGSELKALEGFCDEYEPFLPGHYYRGREGKMHRWYTRDWMDYAAVKDNYTPAAERNAAPASIGRTAYSTQVTAVHDALEAAVQRQLMSDVPYGVLLSGGLDSSVISAIAKKYAAKRIETDNKADAWWPQLHSFAVGLKGAPDLIKAREVARHIGTVHHEINYTVQEGLDAVRDVIYFIETYDITTVRASTPMYLLARVIKSMGIKMVLSGEGADEVFGGYLYFHKAPTPQAFHEETVRKLSKLHLYDCLRANKSLAAWGVEGRVPFLDKEFLDVAMRINPAVKMCPGKEIEKKVVREAFADMLPQSVAWRQKEQFSDGVGYSWIDTLKAVTAAAVSDEQMAHAAERFPIHTPQNKEEYYYRTIFEEHFPSESAARSVPSVPSVACSTAEALAWDASFQGKNDPSGRAVAGVHEEAYKD